MFPASRANFDRPDQRPCLRLGALKRDARLSKTTVSLTDHPRPMFSGNSEALPELMDSGSSAETSDSFSGVKAVILDVYHTLLHVDPGPPDAGEHWAVLWGNTLRSPNFLVLSLAEFNAACRSGIARDHASKKAAGVTWPEVDWRAIACGAAPGLSGLSSTSLDLFLTAHAALERACSAMPGALEFLSRTKQRGLALGIASNAQAYTLEEMRAAGIPPEQFDPDLCFWSWREGFSKPDPGVFQFLTTRLAARGIAPHEILMIGDRLDNDILPARAAGWKVWHFTGGWPVW